MAATSKDKKSKVKEVLEELEPLVGRILELLQQHRARGRRLTAGNDRELRCGEFLELELTGLVATLGQMSSLSELGPDYVDKNIQGWLDMSEWLISGIRTFLNRSVRATVRGCHAPCCFSRDAGLSLPHLSEASWCILPRLAESTYRYMHLLQENDGDRNSSTPTSYEAGAGAGGSIILGGSEHDLSSKKLRWFMAEREDNKIVKIISVVGPVGVGKTTLAMKVYRQLQQIRGGHYFQCYATAKVSRKPDIVELLKHILQQLDEPAALTVRTSRERPQITMLENENHKLLARNIKQCLQKKRYLIVIDDIWNESDWDIIKDAFPRDSPGSRIMITTQLTSIARWCCSHSAGGLVHQVKPMSKPDAERLLFKKAFGSEDGCPQENLKVACDEILRRCQGIPLFIIGMAKWLKEQQQDVQRTSTNYTLEKISQLPKQFEQALYPTYDDLRRWLKVLLLTMSMFPRGYMLEKDSLIEKWISTIGLIDSHDPDELVVKAENYFSELVNRNIITRVAVATPNRTPQVDEACKWQVNYFMLQFLASKSAEKGFFLTSGTLTSVVEGDTTLRWLSLHQPDPDLPALLGKMDLSHTRSLAISGKVDEIPLDKFMFLLALDLEGWQCLKDEDMLLVCKMFFLRNLSLRNTRVSKLPPEIKQLKELSTLDISHTRITELPSEACELLWLQNLDLRGTKVRQLPEKIWKIQMLHRVLIGGDGVNRDEIVTEIPELTGRLESLYTLANVDLSRCSPSLVEGLGGMVNLRVLAITCSFHQCTDRRFQLALRSSIGEWHFLRSLTIHCGLGCCMDFLYSLHVPSGYLEKLKVSGGRFARLPEWFSWLHSLAFIEVTVCALFPGDLGSILSNLRKLKCLVLGLHFIPEAEIVIYGMGFEMLERLAVSCRVPWLTFSEGAMPKLTHLELKITGSPASEESVPSGISNLSSLSDVAIHYSEWYTNSLSVKRTVEAVRKGVAEHRNSILIDLVINGVLQEPVETAEKDPARVSRSQNEIEEVDGRIPSAALPWVSTQRTLHPSPLPLASARFFLD